MSKCIFFLESPGYGSMDNEKRKYISIKIKADDTIANLWIQFS
jgi:hypothetical protein